MNIIKVLWRRFQKCLETFTMLLVKGSSELGIFRHLSDYVFGVDNFKNAKSMRVTFFSKYLKSQLNFKYAAKNLEKYFCFWDNCIWIDIVKLSLLRIGYSPSAAILLLSSPKIFHVNKGNFFQLNWLGSAHWIW